MGNKPGRRRPPVEVRNSQPIEITKLEREGGEEVQATYVDTSQRDNFDDKLRRPTTSPNEKKPNVYANDPAPAVPRPRTGLFIHLMNHYIHINESHEKYFKFIRQYTLALKCRGQRH